MLTDYEPSVIDRCRRIGRHRIDTKIMWAALAVIVSLFELWAITAGRAFTSFLAMFMAVNFAVVASWAREDAVSAVIYSPRRQSWRFLATVTLLPVLAAFDASGYPQVRSSFYHSDSWWVLLGFTVIVGTTGYRLGVNLPASTDYLKFNSYGAVAQSFFCFPVSLLAVALALPVILFAPWTVSGGIAHVIMILLVLSWPALAFVDDLRESWTNDWRLDRDVLHVQGSELGEELTHELRAPPPLELAPALLRRPLRHLANRPAAPTTPASFGPPPGSPDANNSPAGD